MESSGVSSSKVPNNCASVRIGFWVLASVLILLLRHAYLPWDILDGLAARFHIVTDHGQQTNGGNRVCCQKFSWKVLASLPLVSVEVAISCHIGVATGDVAVDATTSQESRLTYVLTQRLQLLPFVLR